MASIYKTVVQGLMLRATLVDECGEVVVGDCAYATSKCFASIAMSDNVEDGEEFKTKAADGTFCVNQRAKPQLNWIEVTGTLRGVDPELVAILTGSPLIYDGDGIAVGIQTTTTDYASASFALEVWTGTGKTVGAAVCEGGDLYYGYLLLPWITEGVIGDITIENAAADFTFSGITSNGSAWGQGPYDVVTTSLGAASPLLEEIGTDVHRHMQWTTLAPPAAVVGCQALDPVS